MARKVCTRKADGCNADMCTDNGMQGLQVQAGEKLVASDNPSPLCRNPSPPARILANQPAANFLRKESLVRIKPRFDVVSAKASNNAQPLTNADSEVLSASDPLSSAVEQEVCEHRLPKGDPKAQTHDLPPPDDSND